jgi:hypothetical protein
MEKIVSVVVVLLFCASCFTAVSIAEGGQGFEGVSWRSVVPESRVILVGYDPDSLTDDLCYLAALPYAVYEDGGILRSSPLLFYAPPNDVEELNDFKGLDYFMSDYIEVCGGGLDEIVMINIEFTERIRRAWKADEYISIRGTPDEVSAELEMLYGVDRKEVVVPMAGEDSPFAKFDQIEGFLDGHLLNSYSFHGLRDVGTYSTFHDFEVMEPYKYVTAYMQWQDPGKDPDLQLWDPVLGMVEASENWNVIDGPWEYCESPIYNHGTWRAALTYMPTKSLVKEGEGAAEYDLVVTLLPGEEIPLDTLPRGTSALTIELDSQEGVVGILMGPNGASWGIVRDTAEFTNLAPGPYSLLLLQTTEIAGEVPYTISYSYEGVKSDIDDLLATAANAAIYASLTGRSLLFYDGEEVPDDAVLFETFSDLPEGKKYTSYEEIYQLINSITGETDIVFTTTDPATSIMVDRSLVESDYGFYVGPAAFASAHHGSPLLVVDVHEKLDASAKWHTITWKASYESRSPPSVAGMTSSGLLVYEFLGEMGLDDKGKEYILTVADHMDIGASWDRSFIGKAYPGRIQGTPVDCSYWVSRSVFYPVLIFANPALNPDGNRMITGSSSMRDERGNLLLTDGGGEVTLNYPILQTWVSYEHEFNEIGEEYWGLKYETRTGIAPGETASDNPVDPGYWPDMTVSEIVSFYTDQMGYGSTFSTAFSESMENLNRGAILWFEIMHGGHSGDGGVGFWNPGAGEVNPWRGWESLGSTANPDTVAMNKQTGMDNLYGVSDGVVIAILEQHTQTLRYGGNDFDQALDNVYSTGVIAGSCLIANTFLHTALVRHGSVFQLIDPWLTSWYVAYAMQIFARSLLLGASVGEAYVEAISAVGISYLDGGWWWDIFENVVYYGDPELRVYSPLYTWEFVEPVSV